MQGGAEFADTQITSSSTSPMFYEHKGILVYSPTLKQRVMSTLPDAKELSGGYVAFPKTLYNCQVARWLGLPVPPIMDDYDWPIKGVIPGTNEPMHPLEHQKLMANWMVLNPKGFNLSDMGTMKTLSALWAVDWLMQRYPGAKCLIVCPRSTTKLVWGDALVAHFLGRRSFEIIKGSAEKRVDLLQKPVDFFIVNYDGIKIGAHNARQGKRRVWVFESVAKELLEHPDIKFVIIDEADAYKDGRTDRSRVARTLFGHRDYLWLMTGTPVPTGPPDAWGLSLFVNNANGESYTSFHRRTMVQLSQHKFVPHREGYKAAYELLQPAIRVDIKDVWDGPELTYQQREVELTSQQRQMLQGLKNELAVEVKSGTIIPANEADKRNKALQLILGAIYDKSHDAHQSDAQARLKEARDVVAKAAGKVLIFAGLTSIVKLVYEYLSTQGLSCEMVIGATSDKERADIFARFQNDLDPKVIIADPGTMAHGLNLYAATCVLWYGSTDRPGLYVQGNKRAHRPGQRYPVTVVELVSTSLERSIYSRLRTAQNLQGTLLDWIKGGVL